MRAINKNFGGASPYRDKIKFYSSRGRYFYAKSLYDGGMKTKEIAEKIGISFSQTRILIIRANKSKSKPFKMNHDVFLEFKNHYDEIMFGKN